jgi:hypothetical protein
MKPDNVMVIPSPGRPGRVKILDFGLAKIRSALLAASGSVTAETAPVTTTPGLLVGTVNYMAPEQLSGEAVDARTDNYGLGLVLYEMATGVNPFLGQTPASTIANILTREPPALSERNPVAPAELNRILRKCLRKRREERYQTARELLVDLSNLRGELTQPAASAPAEIVTTAPQTPLTISRGLARALFLAIQIGYLAMYGALSYYLPSHFARVQIFSASPTFWTTVPFIGHIVLCGAAVRFYFLAAIGLDYPDSGRLFRQLVPAILLLDLVWAAAPLLLVQEVGSLSFFFAVGLAYLPFSQRTLMFAAYAPTGGRSSGVRAASAL